MALTFSGAKGAQLAGKGFCKSAGSIVQKGIKLARLEKVIEKVVKIITKLCNKKVCFEVVHKLDDIAENIYNHSWNKHIIKQKEFLEISTKLQFIQKIQDTISGNFTHTKLLSNGRKAIYNSKDNTLVIYNSEKTSASTMFRPKTKMEYYNKNLK